MFFYFNFYFCKEAEYLLEGNFWLLYQPLYKTNNVIKWIIINTISIIIIIIISLNPVPKRTHFHFFQTFWKSFNSILTKEMRLAANAAKQ